VCTHQAQQPDGCWLAHHKPRGTQLEFSSLFAHAGNADRDYAKLRAACVALPDVQQECTQEDIDPDNCIMK